MSGRGSNKRTGKPGAKSAKNAIVKNISKDFFKCGACEEEVGEECNSIECHQCRVWFHQECTDLIESEFKLLNKGKASIIWKCESCLKAKGDETKKFIQLESRLEQMMGMLLGVEDKIMKEVQDKISKEIEEQMSRLEDRIKTNIEKDSEEKIEKERRKDNIVLVNIPENDKSNSEESNKEDLELVKDMLNSIVEIEEGEISNLTRLGSKRDKKDRNYKPRNIKITITSQSKRNILFKNAQKLNVGETDPRKKIYMNNDLTPQEREAQMKLREEFKNLKRQGEVHIKIDYKKGKIVSTLDTASAATAAGVSRDAEN